MTNGKRGSYKNKVKMNTEIDRQPSLVDFATKSLIETYLLVQGLKNICTLVNGSINLLLYLAFLQKIKIL